ncbi:MAG: molybdopterin molybdenumtransferase MoeA [Chloroflexi bacterium AL-N10]|nr:molybdopterin molybdenumtransferase MoeA [Chloroflexi bacterium AL-N1]NOK69879.1 molybdopterin molybdenumtransferase MoeA [Chloroflexi bacterium AL-N10]NOK73824.1 molybdopterin molybdenumtransferase MoeA [Chloroflexi bacterium AL-N5]NOK91612.1 molybdopterin molybdenumtransferase MoeA [Chloroflexi bacterium AL-N15]
MRPMLRDSPYPMLPIEDAQRIIGEHTRLIDSEEIDCCAMLPTAPDGRVLAEDVYATETIPDVPKAAVDGYALQVADNTNERRVLAEIAAGMEQSPVVEPGTAVRIMTGAPIPQGADAVIMVEDTEERAGLLHVQRMVQQGQNIHVVGQDVAHGALVLACGTSLGAAEVGLLATIGRTRIAVARRPRVAVLSTGDEVREPDLPREVGGIRDSNRYALLAAVREAGGEAISLGIARDDEQAQRQAILRGLEQADVLLTSGGVSMGTRDLIKPLLSELGTVHFGRVLFKPGKPTTFATVQDTLVFGLPGYPVSSLVSFEVFVRPALRRMQGAIYPDRPRVQVTLCDTIKAAPDRPEYQRVIVRWEEGQLVAQSTGAQGSSRLLSLRAANALLLVPSGGQVYQAGDRLEALLVGSLVPS